MPIIYNPYKKKGFFKLLSGGTKPSSDASFSYAQASYPKDGTNPTPTITGDTGGTFTASPVGLNINSSTGEVTLSTSTINSYTVKYTLSDGTFTEQTLGITAASFTNTYSMAFDGVGDTVNFQNEWFAPSTPSQTTGNTVGSFSFWVKLPTNISSGGLMGMVSINVGASSKPIIWIMFNRTASSTGRYIRAYVSGANSTQTGVLQTQQFFIYDDSSTTYPNSGITFSADTWYHIAIVHDKDATNRYKAYINGNQFLIPNTTGTGSNGERTIGEMPYSLPYNPTATGITPNVDLGFSRTSSSGGSQYFEGNLDEVAFWNSALTSANVTSIYNSGTPNNLNDLTTPPIDWYRMGENGSYKSPQWLLPENSNKDKYSKYSFSLDGIGDRFSFGDIPFLKAGGSYFSISMWVKVDTTTQRGFFGARSATPHQIGFYIDTNGYLILQIKNGTSGDIQETSTSALANDTWLHIGATFDGTESTASDRIKLYVNGSAVASSTTGTGTNLPNGSVTVINYIGSTFSGVRMVGEIGDSAIWDSALTSGNMTSIYNSGTPTTLPVTPVAHWKMGTDATFSTNWTVPDSIGSFDLTSENMTIEDRVGEAPNSSNNSLSYNMVEADRETDTP